MTAPASASATGDDVLAAAAALVDAFGSHNPSAYFDCFTPDATFLFHNYGGLISSRAEYEQLWRTWEQEGFRVLGCRSLEPRVHLLDERTAVFTHRVRTVLAGAQTEQTERETMVFTRSPDGRWLVAHEHLSIDPVSGDEETGIESNEMAA